MQKFLSFLVVVCVFCLYNTEAKAQDLVYQAKNPAFGGDTFNYQWLQSSAQAQDKFKDPDSTSPTSSLLNRDPLKEFEENLNRQILNQLSRQLITSQFGEDGLAPGEYTIGSYHVNVTGGDNGVNIQITDSRNGNQTTVTIPYY